MPFVRAAVAALILLVAPGFGGLERSLAPDAEPWPRWEAHDPASTRTVDHAPWGRLLAARLRVDAAGPNRFDYAGVTPAERAALDAYLAALSETPVSALSRPEQFAFWANLYNALTIRVVLDHYPVDSIRDIDISSGLFADGPWGAELIEVEGVPLSLDAIEHRILRPIWRDPRIHYAVNCAAVGCPDLRPEPWRAATLDADLDAAARAYVNDPRGVRTTSDGLVISKIYDWFAEDFGGDAAGVRAHLAAHADAGLADALADSPPIADTAYDWSLNAAR